MLINFFKLASVRIKSSRIVAEKKIIDGTFRIVIGKFYFIV